MGVLIIVGVTFLGVTVYKRFGHSTPVVQDTPPLKPQDAMLNSPFTKQLKLGADERITKMAQGEETLSLFVRSKQKGERILFIDNETGMVRGTLFIDHEPAAKD